MNRRRSPYPLNQREPINNFISRLELTSSSFNAIANNTLQHQQAGDGEQGGRGRAAVMNLDRARMKRTFGWLLLCVAAAMIFKHSDVSSWVRLLGGM